MKTCCIQSQHRQQSARAYTMADRAHLSDSEMARLADLRSNRESGSGFIHCRNHHWPFYQRNWESFYLKRNNLYSLLLFRPYSKLATNSFVLAVYVLETAPYRTQPTADENVAVTIVSSSLFQSATVLTKNEFLYFSVLLSDILKPQEFRISCLAMVLSESQPLKMVWLILLRFLSAGIGKFSGGVAGMWR